MTRRRRRLRAWSSGRSASAAGDEALAISQLPGQAASLRTVVACHKPGRAVGALRATKRPIAVLVGLAAAVGGLSAPLAPAFAGQLQTAKARAAALLVQADNEALLVHDLTLRYQQDAARADFWHAQTTRAEAEATSLRQRSTMTRALLQEEAVLSYADSVPSESPAAGPASENFVEVADRQAYMTAAIGDLSTTLQEYNTERSNLVATIASAKQDVRANLASEDQARADRREALQEAASLQAMLAQTRSEIAALSARQRAATGPPVGNGIVKAVATQLGATSSAPSAILTTTTL